MGGQSATERPATITGGGEAGIEGEGRQEPEEANKQEIQHPQGWGCNGLSMDDKLHTHITYSHAHIQVLPVCFRELMFSNISILRLVLNKLKML